MKTEDVSSRPARDLTERQRIILEAIWKSFTESCDWPIHQWLDLTLSHDQKIDIGAELRALPDGMVIWDHNPRDDSPVRLTMKGLSMVSGSQGDQAHFIHALRWLLKKESEMRLVPGQIAVLQLSSAQAAEEWTQAGGEGDNLSIRKAGALLAVESRFFLSGYGNGERPDRVDGYRQRSGGAIKRFRTVKRCF